MTALAPGHLPVADADGSNLVCMDRETGRIYSWDHERHDRSYSGEADVDGPEAAEDVHAAEDAADDEPPVEGVASLAEFIEALVEAEPPPAPAPPEPGNPAVRKSKSADLDELFKDYLDK
ncbi:MAG: hypothetical protein AB7N65_07470 [Vicinamibacterales bacterium]